MKRCPGPGHLSVPAPSLSEGGRPPRFPDDATPDPCYARIMSSLPTKQDILDWISENPTLTSKRDIAKAFGIKGAARIDLKRVLKDARSIRDASGAAKEQEDSAAIGAWLQILESKYSKFHLISPRAKIPTYHLNIGKISKYGCILIFSILC